MFEICFEGLKNFWSELFIVCEFLYKGENDIVNCGLMLNSLYLNCIFKLCFVFLFFEFGFVWFL